MFILSLIYYYVQPFQLRNNHRRAVAKEMQQQHTSFDSSSLSSTLNMINTKDSSGGDDTTKFKDPLKSVDEGVLSAKVPYNYKDHPLLASPPSRRLSDTPVCSVGGGFIDCDNGYVRDTPAISCADACAASSAFYFYNGTPDGGTCCEGTAACTGFTGEIDILLSRCLFLLLFIIILTLYLFVLSYDRQDMSRWIMHWWICLSKWCVLVQVILLF